MCLFVFTFRFSTACLDQNSFLSAKNLIKASRDTINELLMKRPMVIMFRDWWIELLMECKFAMESLTDTVKFKIPSTQSQS